jgi:hypothetical protein
VPYLSEEGHGCMHKAAELMGIGSENARFVAVDEALRMRVDDLHAQITADLAAGHQPLAVAASTGTVNIGAKDPSRPRPRMPKPCPSGITPSMSCRRRPWWSCSTPVRCCTR